MITISISDKAMRTGGIVVLPRREYEQLLHVSELSGLDESLDISLAEARAGKVYGPFKSARALMKSLRTKR